MADATNKQRGQFEEPNVVSQRLGGERPTRDTRLPCTPLQLYRRKPWNKVVRPYIAALVEMEKVVYNNMLLCPPPLQVRLGNGREDINVGSLRALFLLPFISQLQIPSIVGVWG